MLLIDPLLCLRINVAASTGSIFANSIKAMATRTGALPNPATQCIAMVGPVKSGWDKDTPSEEWVDPLLSPFETLELGVGWINLSSTSWSQRSRTSSGGECPSGYGISCRVMPAPVRFEPQYVFSSHTRTISVTLYRLHSLMYRCKLADLGVSMMRNCIGLLLRNENDGFAPPMTLELGVWEEEMMAVSLVAFMMEDYFVLKRLAEEFLSSES